MTEHCVMIGERSARAAEDAAQSKAHAIWLPIGSFLNFGAATTGGMKQRKTPVEVTLQMKPKRFREFERANLEIERRTGSAPGVEALMILTLDASNDPHELADLYCFKVLRQSPELIALYPHK